MASTAAAVWTPLYPGFLYDPARFRSMITKEGFVYDPVFRFETKDGAVGGLLLHYDERGFRVGPVPSFQGPGANLNIEALNIIVVVVVDI
ncbi:hypothetical protein OsI_16602 [Oryza sativa Indica Group]|jgi:hypothetical protein|uniref:Uncharacterized protein n=2 Tax=Oryza sativa TaxID=4530 RepID=B9FG35_ORYSJ|nr:hypothetical protein OsI_16602 [Oryza sativa Indica Group]EEE61319.1 hypothetical protein OsJ_15426 [Oryza sativa Japonica Group]